MNNKQRGERREDDERRMPKSRQTKHGEAEHSLPAKETQTEKRRGQRSRNKPSFYGNILMVTQVSPSKDTTERSPEY